MCLDFDSFQFREQTSWSTKIRLSPSRCLRATWDSVLTTKRFLVQRLSVRNLPCRATSDWRMAPSPYVGRPFFGTAPTAVSIILQAAIKRSGCGISAWAVSFAWRLRTLLHAGNAARRIHPADGDDRRTRGPRDRASRITPRTQTRRQLYEMRAKYSKQRRSG